MLPLPLSDVCLRGPGVSPPPGALAALLLLLEPQPEAGHVLRGLQEEDALPLVHPGGLADPHARPPLSVLHTWQPEETDRV